MMIKVWMLILCSIFAIIAMLILLDYFKGPPGSGRSKIHLHWLFVIGSLFGRGGFWASSKNRIRILMAVWLFGTYILVGFYTSQLFGYLVTSIQIPTVLTFSGIKIPVWLPCDKRN